MKKLLVYLLAAMLALPALGSESEPVRINADGTSTEISAATSKASKRKKPKKKKRKDIYRPGARQN